MSQKQTEGMATGGLFNNVWTGSLSATEFDRLYTEAKRAYEDLKYSLPNYKQLSRVIRELKSDITSELHSSANPAKARSSWTTEQLNALSGFVKQGLSNAIIAQKLGRSVNSVCVQISKTTPRGDRSSNTKIEWTEFSDSLLGTMPDEKVSSKLGISAAAVHARRKKLNIKAFTIGAMQGAGRTKWNPEMDAFLMSTVSNIAVAKQLGVTITSVEHRRFRLKKTITPKTAET